MNASAEPVTALATKPNSAAIHEARMEEARMKEARMK